MELPEWMERIEIENMSIHARELSEEGKEQIKNRFPRTRLKFSDTLLQSTK